MEAIACGTPVISFDVGGCGESASLYGTTVPNNDIICLAEKIQQISKGKIAFSKPNLEAANLSSYEKYFQLLEGKKIEESL